MMLTRSDPARAAGRASVLVLATKDDAPAQMLVDRLDEAAVASVLRTYPTGLDLRSQHLPSYGGVASRTVPGR